MLEVEHGRAPALIGILPRSIYSECGEADAIRAAMVAAKGHPFAMPVLYGNRIAGFVRARSYYSDEIAFYKTPHKLWAGFSTYDDLVSEMTAGKRLPLAWAKAHTTAPVANNWHDMWPVGGNPSAGVYSNTAATAVAVSDTTVGALYHGGNKSTDTKHLVSLLGWSSAGTPTLMLVDRVLVYDGCTNNGASNQVLTQTGSAARYATNSDSGLQIFMVVTAVSGATAANLTQLRYTDNLGNTLHSMPTSPTVATIVSVAAPTATLGARVFTPATNAATLPWGATIPLLAGDLGVRLVNDYTLSANNTGTFSIILARPLAYIPIGAAAVATQLDQIIQNPGLERVYDGACLNLWSYFPAATASTFGGSVDVAWG